MMYYVDTNVFVYPLIYSESRDRRALYARNILTRIASGELKAATSSLTWDEFTWVILKTLGAQISIEKGREFLSFPNLRILRVDIEVLKKAQVMIERYGVKPRDAIHAACAIANDIREIVSDDKDFDQIKELKRVRLEEI